MTITEFVNAFYQKKALPLPATFWSATDAGNVQIYQLFLEEIRELAKLNWPETKIAKTFNTIAAQDQGSVYSIIGADFSHLVAATMWNNTLKRPIVGPVSDSGWANLQAFPSTGSVYQFKVFGNKLNIFPTPTAGQTVYLIYQSSYGLTNSSGTPIAAPSATSDIILLPPEVLLRGLEYRWERERGLPSWQTTYIEYTDLKARAMGRTGLPTLHLDRGDYDLAPGIWVPAGDWPH